MTKIYIKKLKLIEISVVTQLLTTNFFFLLGLGHSEKGIRK